MKVSRNDLIFSAHTILFNLMLNKRW